MGRGRRSNKRPWGGEHVPLDMERLGSLPRQESGPDGEDFHVRTVRGSSKTYRCPGCDQEILPGTQHVVAWPTEHIWGADASAESRRHWHTSCWRQRGNRAPTRRR
ncbi:Putative ATP/GTP-binding protein, doubtful CDS [Actinomycetales bacterium JB111]|nr:Putative ATP/GTP-binding protein, doubtful CDS [Actinomycetales bacterium JB111]